MKFKANTRRRALEYEKALVQQWKENKTFEKSIELRPKENSYVFYDGPPFISGVPHHGTLLSSIVKDAVPRYQTMKGKRVERVWGWDAHGLPAERYTEKKLGINSRQEVIEYGIENYITATRANMLETSSLWEDTIDRIGRWVDFKGAYKTMDKDYMESIWWAFKTLYEKGKIYEGEKVLMYCTLDATPLSKAEVTMDAGAYQDVTDPSVYTKFKLINHDAKNITLTDKSKVLFVCYANINRSQIAKAVYNFMTNSNNASGAGVAVDDTHPEATTYGAAMEALAVGHEGRARTALRKKYGVDIVESERRQLKRSDLEQYDLVVDITGENASPSWFQGSNVVRWNIDDTVGDGVDRETVMNRNITDIEARVKKLIDGEVVDDGSTLLAWTTTPWTLPANTALAVNPAVTYAEVAVSSRAEGEPAEDNTSLVIETFIVAKDLIETVFTDAKHKLLEYTILREFPGSNLVGLSYEPLFEGHPEENAHKIWAADYVTTESGTGIVHIAPAYGEEDFALAREKKIPVVHVLDENGEYTETEWKGENVWAINKTIAKTLHERGTVWKIDYIRHSYPHCHRCGTKLMYRAHPSWFFDIENQREQMLKQNGDIEWFPAHVKNGRFAKTIEQAPDWNISRDRFWATAMPVWKTESGKVKVIGSYAELKELSGVELEDYHRPWIDDVTFEIDGETYTRIDKVMDSWFEAGSMPFAQFHYPFENKDKFEANFPGDFIVEYIGQVRAWFYYMHAMSVALFGENSFKNVIVTGNVAGNDGRKMSKSYGNYTDPNELMDKFSADSLRFLLLQSPLLNGEDFALQDKEVGDIARKLSMVWNMYDFFTMYADVDGWEFNGELVDPSDEATNPLDQWIISRVHQLIQNVETHMDAYDIPNAVSPILPFLDDASNWYVRRSRRRFWKSEDDKDKDSAYKTLHYVLVRLSQALAPFVPFMAEELYQKLTGGESVHLTDWPEVGHANQLVLDHMTQTRDIIEQGLALRMYKSDSEAQIKVRQPLATLSYSGEKLDEFYESIIAEEVNVKEVVHSIVKDVVVTVTIDKTITPELRREGFAREVIRHVQSARKNAGLNVDDRIILSLEAADDELAKAIEEYSDVIAAETLTEAFVVAEHDHTTEAVIEGVKLTVSLKKA